MVIDGVGDGEQEKRARGDFSVEQERGKPSAGFVARTYIYIIIFKLAP